MTALSDAEGEQLNAAKPHYQHCERYGVAFEPDRHDVLPASDDAGSNPCGQNGSIKFWVGRSDAYCQILAAWLPAFRLTRPAFSTERIAQVSDSKRTLLRCGISIKPMSPSGSVQTAMRTCTRDEGRSFEAGSQVPASNRCKISDREPPN